MTLQARDRRALAGLGVAVLLALLILYWPQSGGPVVAPVVESIPLAEQRVNKLRETVATLPGRRKVVDAMRAQLQQREKGLFEAETAPQAQALLLTVVRKLTRAQSPPIEITSNELGSVVPLGKDYGETFVSISMVCRIEQLVNLLADITAQPELIATHDLRIQAGDARQKTLTVRLTISGVLPRRLVPERRGLGVL